MDGSTGNPTSSEQSQYSHRGRAIKSCLECRRRKMRCSRSQPCQNCSRFSRGCVYLPYPDWPSNPVPRGKVFSSGRTYDKQENWARAPRNTDHRTNTDQQSPSNLSGSEAELNLQVKLGGLNDADPGDVLQDRMEIGRLKITGRIGNYFKPQITQRVASALAQHNELSPTYSPTLDNSHIKLPYYSRFNNTLHQSEKTHTVEPPSALLLSVSRCPKEWGNYFPSRGEIHILYHQYFKAVDPFAHVIHKPSFDSTCYHLSQSSPTLATAPASFKALLLSVCLAAAVSLSPMQSQLELGIAKQNELVAKLKNATELALINANYAQSIQMETLQALTIYMIPQCRAEVSRSHITLVGTLVRVARNAGLHTEARGSLISATERQVRRLLWHQICFLDLRTAEIFGSQPAIRDYELDTPLPLNVDDVSLNNSYDQPLFSNQWTDATFTLLRYECYLVHRLIYRMIREVEDNKTGLETVRRVVNDRKAQIEEKYINHFDASIPIQHCAEVVGRLLTSKFDTMLLPEKLQDDEATSSQREIHETLIYASLTVCENAILLDTAADLTPWSWYGRAYQRYCTSVFLLLEVYGNPRTLCADRIGAVLDYIYGPPSVSSGERNRDVLKTLASNMDGQPNIRKGQAMEPPMEGLGIVSPMVSAPDFGMVNPSQRINDWQAGMNYGESYAQDLIPPDGDEWWGYPPCYTFPEHPMNRQIWTNEFETSTGTEWSA